MRLPNQHPEDAAIQAELDLIRRDMAERPEDPTIDVRIAAAAERSRARGVAFRAERDERYRLERAEAGVIGLPVVITGQVVERIVYAVAGFFAAGGFRGFLRRQDRRPR